jgi:hypothetical protein
MSSAIKRLSPFSYNPSHFSALLKPPHRRLRNSKVKKKENEKHKNTDYTQIFN